MYYIIGLGNPGEEYELTRHNAGRMAVLEFLKKEKMDDPELDKKFSGLASKGEIGKEKVQVILPETFMNKSGLALKTLARSSPKKLEKMIVVHDDIDLPLGKIKISFAKNSAGHKGVESVIKAVKTVNFIRVRIGISVTDAKGRVKKPSGDKFLDYIVGKFKPAELAVIKKSAKKAAEAIDVIIKEGLGKAMGEYNSS
ncbi:aminoacyl-tRNA hydrolase [Candidatus Parcubacteria bacterium]|nr:MAG: aminoacyl-tRNA hydrolase [Candidatus Parcubacteria bacterium]